MASPLFCQGFLDDFGFEALFGVHFFEAPILLLKIAQPSHQRCVHAAELGAPFVEGGRADTVLAAQLWYRASSLGLLGTAMI